MLILLIRSPDLLARPVIMKTQRTNLNDTFLLSKEDQISFLWLCLDEKPRHFIIAWVKNLRIQKHYFNILVGLFREHLEFKP